LRLVLVDRNVVVSFRTALTRGAGRPARPVFEAAAMC
jgi:hypothetical protein